MKIKIKFTQFTGDIMKIFIYEIMMESKWNTTIWKAKENPLPMRVNNTWHELTTVKYPYSKGTQTTTYPPGAAGSTFVVSDVISYWARLLSSNLHINFDLDI
jgi:hypothetical protein